MKAMDRSRCTGRRFAVLTNISLDHKEMDELRNLFTGFLGAARKAIVNLDDPEVRSLAADAAERQVVGYGFDDSAVDIQGSDVELRPTG